VDIRRQHQAQEAAGFLPSQINLPFVKKPIHLLIIVDKENMPARSAVKSLEAGMHVFLFQEFKLK
jgi:hypothetical protein